MYINNTIYTWAYEHTFSDPPPAAPVTQVSQQAYQMTEYQEMNFAKRRHVVPNYTWSLTAAYSGNTG